MFRPGALYILFLTALCFSAKAQDKQLNMSYDNGTNLNVLYRSDLSAKIYANTRGLGFLLRRGRHVTGKTRSYLELDAQTLRHPKEVKLVGEGTERKRFIYGKLNNALLLRAAYGFQNVIFSKADNKAVEVRYAVSLGPTLGLAKPYYIQIYRTGISEFPYTVFDETIMSNRTQVMGRAPFSKGMNELRLHPGASAKFNLSFEYAPYTNLIRAIETGVSLDFFPTGLPLMAFNPAEKLVLTLNVGLVFGRKWF